MNELIKHIEILLLNHDCVIIPGFGGFTTQHVDSCYDESDQTFFPPKRTIGFNSQLKMNDSLLAQSYIEAFDLSYPDAVNRIENEVEMLWQHINDNNVLEMGTIGTFTKNDWYKLGTAQIHGWFFLSIADRTIIPVDQIDLSLVTKPIQETNPEYRPPLKPDNKTKAPGDNDYIVIPGTNIRLYESDIIKISNKPRVKWVVHMGWYIYQNVQNFGWYIESIKNGEILPVSVIDLTLVTLVTTRTQGSELTDGKVVNYTRPFTLADAAILNRTFISFWKRVCH